MSVMVMRSCQWAYIVGMVSIPHVSREVTKMLSSVLGPNGREKRGKK
jgi:hypothetical protein